MVVVDGQQILLSDIKELPCLDLGHFTLKLEVDTPSQDVIDIARKELRETPEIVQESVKALRELLKQETDLKVPIDSDAWLIRFLRPTKFYPESALTLVKNYYQFKVKHKNVYENLLPSREKNVFNHDILTVLPRRDQLGRRILILELGKKWKHNKCSLDEVYKGAVLFLEAAMLEPQSQICGAEVIFDMDGLSLPQTWQFTPPFAKRIVDWLQESVPMRIKGVHIVNQPFIFNIVFNLFKPFLKEKLRSRIKYSYPRQEMKAEGKCQNSTADKVLPKIISTIREMNGFTEMINFKYQNAISIIFHGTDRDSLHQYLSPKCLPECYGGTLDVPRVKGVDWYQVLSMLEKEFEAVNSYGYKNTKNNKKS